MRRLLLTVIATAMLVLLPATHALAVHCTVADKPVGAGSKILVDITSGEVTQIGPGNGGGGFASLDFDGDGVADADAFNLPVTPALEDDEGIGVGLLPEGARNAGPGDSECDGKGVDDLFC